MNRVIIGGLAALAVLTGACGDDDDAGGPDADVTHEEWFQAICDRLGPIDPGFEAFFAEHPQPSLDEWADFLPTPIGVMEQFADVLESTPHAPEDTEVIDDAVDAVITLRDDYQAALDAALDGDQEAFDEADSRSQNTSGPAMEAALEAGDGRDCPAPS